MGKKVLTVAEIGATVERIRGLAQSDPEAGEGEQESLFIVGGPQDAMWAHLKLIMRAGAVKMSTTFDYVERITILRNP